MSTSATSSVKAHLPPIVAVCVLWIAVDLLLDRMHRGPHVMKTVAGALTLIKSAILGLWLGWGGSSILVKIAAIVVTQVILIVPLKGNVWDGTIFISQLESIFIIGAVAALPRVAGFRIVHVDHPHNDVKRRPGRFVLLDLFVWTTCIAIVTGIMRLFGPNDWLRAISDSAVSGLVVGLFTVVTFMLILVPRNVEILVLIPVALVLVAEVYSAGLNKWLGMDNALKVLLVPMLIFEFVLLVGRRLGYRVARPIMQPRDSSKCPDQMRARE